MPKGPRGENRPGDVIGAAIKVAKYLGLGANDAVLTVATDGAELYQTELDAARQESFADAFGELDAAEVFGHYLRGVATDHLLELDQRDRERMFNLGYFTWVEQQGISVADFAARRDPAFWDALVDAVQTARRVFA